MENEKLKPIQQTFQHIESMEEKVLRIMGEREHLRAELERLQAENERLRDACETVTSGYETDGMEGMGARDEVFYKICKTALNNRKK